MKCRDKHYRKVGRAKTYYRAIEKNSIMLSKYWNPKSHFIKIDIGIHNYKQISAFYKSEFRICLILPWKSGSFGSGSASKNAN